MDKKIILERLKIQFEQFITLREKLESKDTLERRRKIFDTFQEVGFPSNKLEDWKYTDMNDFLSEEMYLFTDNTGIIAPKEKILELVSGIGDTTVVFVNGFYNEELSRISENSVEITASGVVPDEIVKEDNGFTLLQKAFAVEDVKIALNATTDKFPVTLLFCTYGTGLPCITQPQVKIASPKGRKGVIIERYVHFGDQKNLTNLSINIDLDIDSSIKHYRKQNFSESMLHVHNLHITQKERSSYEVATLTSGCGIVRNTQEITLCGIESEAALYGAYALDNNGFTDNHTAVIHQASHTRSKQIYKGTLDDKSHGVFNGKVIVEKDLVDINSDQNNKTMLLSEGARMDTKPELQIFSDDVKCSHGAALGHLDEDTLFFMRARGIGEQKAKYILSIGFIQEILQKIDNEKLREELIGQMKNKFLLE